MRKPVVFIAAYWHDKRFKRKTGGLVRIFDLGTDLKRLGIDVVLFLPRIGNPKRQTSARVVEIPFVDFPLIRPISFQINLLIIMFFASFRSVDFLYVRQMSSFAPHIIAKLFHIPIIYEIPNDQTCPVNTHRWSKGALIGRIERICISLADRVVVLSQWSKERLIIRDRVPSAKIHVQVSGSNTDLFLPLPKAQCCRKTRIDPNFRYIGFVGSFLTHQGIETLIKAAPHITRADSNVKYLMVGDGPMRGILRDLAAKCGVKDRFIFTGHVPYTEVPFYIGAMEICVAPFRLGSNQSSPVKLFDYMACGKPIVASDLPVVREIAGSSGCMELVPAEHVDALSGAIIELLADDNRRETMAEAGRRRIVERFSRSAIAGNLLAISKSIGAGTSKRS